MFCIKCGKNIDEGTKFCRFCGTPVASPDLSESDIAGDETLANNEPKGILKGSLAGKSDEEVLEELELSLLIAELDEEMAERRKLKVSENMKTHTEDTSEAEEVETSSAEKEEIAGAPDAESSDAETAADTESSDTETAAEVTEAEPEEIVQADAETIILINEEAVNAEAAPPVQDIVSGNINDEAVDEFVDEDYDHDIDVDVEYKTNRKKYSQTGSERREAYKAKTGHIVNKTKNKSVQMLIAAALIFIAAIAIVIVIIAKSFLGSKVGDFEKSVEAYEEAMMDNDSAFGAYQQLFEKAKEALQNEDTAAFDDLMSQMEDAIEQMTGEMDSQMELSELKEFYDGIFVNYQIIEEYQESYDALMKRLDAAIESRDEDEARALKKELHSLRVNLGNANQNLVQKKINEINRMNMPKANESEMKKLDEYEEKLNAALGEENFIEALKILDEWYATAKDIEERIQADAEKEKAKYQKESRAQAAKEAEEKAKRESEEAAKKESEEAAKRESEEAAKRESEEAAKRESENAAQQNPTPPPAAPTSSYIINGSDSRYLTEADVSGLSAWDKKLARNEIYARHGRRFNNADIQAYFDSQSWYSGTIAPENFDTSVLNDYERKNIELISSLE